MKGKTNAVQKVNIVMLLLGLLFLSCVLVGMLRGAFGTPRIILRVEFPQETMFYKTDMFYDMGEGFSEQHKVSSAEYDVKHKEFVIEIPEGLLLDCQKVRFDLEYHEYDSSWVGSKIEISEIAIGRGIFSKKIDNAILTYMENSYDLGWDGYETCVLEGNDPFVVFNEEFIAILEEQNNTFEMYAMIGVVGCSLLIGCIFFLCIKFVGKLALANYQKYHEKMIWLSHKIQKVREFHEKGYFGDTIEVLIILAVTLFLYRKYLFGQYYYLFVNMAGDSFNQTYPMLMNWAYRMQEGINQGGWDFYNGLGITIGHVGILIESWVSLFGTQSVAYLMGISQICKVFLAGVFFYYFLRTTSKKKSTALIFALSYAYCGHMIGRQMWTYYPNEVVMIALWLFCFELFFCKKDWRWLPLASVIFAVNSGPYSVALYLMFFTGYAIFRYCTENQFVWSELIKYFGRFMVVSWTAFLLIEGIRFGSGLVGEIGSERFQKVSTEFVQSEENETQDEIKEELMQEIEVMPEEEKHFISDANCLRTVFYRFLSTDMLGIEDGRYSGYNVYLSGPVFYCGLWTILIIPLGFATLQYKKKLWYGFLLGTAGCYILIEPFRTMCNAFTNDTFKQSSFWIIVLLLIVAADCHENIFFKKGKKRPVIALITVLCIALLQVYYISFGDLYYNKIRFLQAIILLLVYLEGILLFFRNKKRRKTIIVGIMVVKCIEVVILNQEAILYGSALSAASVDGDYLYSGYNQDAINCIKNMDPGNAYRIDNQTSVSYSDALIQRYMGTSIYLGGTATEVERTREFYKKLGLPRNSDLQGRLARFSLSDEINTLCGVKYLTNNSGSVYNFGYKYLGKIGNVDMYRNQYALPLGFVYENCMGKEEFEKMNIQERREMLLRTCVLDEENVIPDMYKGIEQLKAEESNIEEYTIDFECVYDNIFSITEQPSEYVIVIKPVISRTMDMTESVFSYLFVCDAEKNVEELTGCDRTIIQINKGTHEYEYAVNNAGVNQFYFKLYDGISIEDIRFYAVPKEEYYKQYIQDIEKLNGNQSVQLTVDEADSAVRGTIQSYKDGILYFSIPYHENWELRVDGAQQEIFKTNYAFIGAEIEEGVHEIELIFRSTEGAGNILQQIFKYIGYTVLVMNFVIYYILKKRKRERE